MKLKILLLLIGCTLSIITKAQTPQQEIEAVKTICKY